MCWLPTKFFCWSLRTGTLAQGALCLVTAGINTSLVVLGLGDLIEHRIYQVCWPLQECYDKYRALEKSLVLGNIVINSFLFILGTLLLNGVKNEKLSHMFPFMFVQGLMISGLAAASTTALVICFQGRHWDEFVPILIFSCFYILLHIYLALVIRAFYNEVRKAKEKVISICKHEGGGYTDKEKEITLEDYVF